MTGIRGNSAFITPVGGTFSRLFCAGYLPQLEEGRKSLRYGGFARRPEAPLKPKQRDLDPRPTIGIVFPLCLVCRLGPLDGSHCGASARIKFDDEQFAALFNELQARGDKQKLMQFVWALICLRTGGRSRAISKTIF